MLLQQDACQDGKLTPIGEGAWKISPYDDRRRLGPYVFFFFFFLALFQPINVFRFLLCYYKETRAGAAKLNLLTRTRHGEWAHWYGLYFILFSFFS